MRFLIVDDEPILREILSEVLKANFSCEVLVAEDGQQALDMLQNNTVSCIITDLVMPQMDGIDFLEQVRNRGLQMPAIILCGKQDKRLLQATKTLQAIHLRKPLEEDKLVESIRMNLAA